MMQVAYYGSTPQGRVNLIVLVSHHWGVKDDVSHMGIEQQSAPMGVL